MSEKGESEPMVAEQWFEIPDEVLELVNQATVDKGNRTFECYNRGLFLENTTPARRERVLLAIEHGINSIVAQKYSDNISGFGLGYGSYSGGNNAESIGVFFSRKRGEDDTKTIKVINEVVASANSTLETFGQPKIPDFTLQNSK